MKRISLLLIILSITVFFTDAVLADCEPANIRATDVCAPPPFLPIIDGFIPFDFRTHFDASVECGPRPDPIDSTSAWYRAATHDIVLKAVTYGNKTRPDIMFATKAHVEEDYGPLPPINPVTGGPVNCRCVVGTGNGPDSLTDLFYAPLTPRVPCFDPNYPENFNPSIDAALAATHGNPEMTSCNYNCEVNPWSLFPVDERPPEYLKYPLCDTNIDGSVRLGVFTLSFPAPTDRFLVYERGMDSEIHIQALDLNDEPIASADIPRYDLDLGNPKLVKYAGFNIRVDTGIPNFIVGPQPVGSVGLQLPKGVLSDKLRITIIPRTDFGADLKILALAPENPDKKANLIPCPINYPAGAEQPSGGGFVIFNSSNGVGHNLELTAILEKVEANTEYDLYLYVDNNDQFYDKWSIKTNKAGNANFHQNLLLTQGTHYLSFAVTKKGSMSDIYETPGIHDGKGTVFYFSAK